jgi:lysophospholipase L1-like esterase
MKPVLVLIFILSSILSGCGGGGGGSGSGVPAFAVSTKAVGGQTWCVLGDSFSSDPSKFSPTPWPVLLQQQTNNTVLDAAVGGFTFEKILSDPVVNGMTPIDYCISQKPSTVFVMSGINDTAPGSTLAPLGPIESNAATVYAKLKQALPSAKIVFVLEQMYDLADYPNPVTMPNKAAVVWYTIYNQGNNNPDPNATINSWAQDVFTNLIALNSYIKGMGPEIVTLNYWQIQQQTGVSPDGLHPIEASSVAIEQSIQQQLGL